MSKSAADIIDVMSKMVSLQYRTFNSKDVLVIFFPHYHPAVNYVKTSYVKILRDLNATPGAIKQFQKHFNDNIVAQVKDTFGADDYQAHLDKTHKFRRREDETAFLWDMVELGRIGLQAGEDLKYEPIFACWKKVEFLHEKDCEYRYSL